MLNSLLYVQTATIMNKMSDVQFAVEQVCNLREGTIYAKKQMVLTILNNSKLDIAQATQIIQDVNDRFNLNIKRNEVPQSVQLIRDLNNEETALAIQLAQFLKRAPLSAVRMMNREL